jgi:DNA-binding ferritin-like protein
MTPTRETLVKEVTRENRQDHPVVQYLQRQVANALVLYANYKHYHWQTFGPLSRDLHLMFDEFAKDVLETIDEMAERIRMIGQNIEKRAFEADARGCQRTISRSGSIHGRDD